MISGINHLTFAIQDIGRSFDFYVGVLGLTPHLRWPDGAYLTAGDTWVTLVKDDEVRSAPLPEYTHLAFSVSSAEFHTLANKIVKSGSPIWQKNWTEGDSLYFCDPDGHKLEIHSSDLEARLADARENPWSEFEFFPNKL